MIGQPGICIDIASEEQYRSAKKWEACDGKGVLRKVPGDQGSEKSQSCGSQEQEAGNPGRVSDLQHQGFQNR
jgi:hypothetical protein